MRYDSINGRWAVNDPEFTGGVIVGFRTASEARDYMRASPGSALVRLKAPRLHGPWSKLWERYAHERIIG